MNYIGDFNVGSTVPLFWTTHDKNGGAIAPSSAFEVADIKLYKNGSDIQRSSEAGWTITSPFDSIVGLHCLSIDLSDNTDAGFYAAGNEYTVVLSPDETIDSEVALSVIGRFSIERASAKLAALQTSVDAISLVTSAGDLATKTPDSATLTTGSNTSGSIADTASDNDVYWITAPVSPAVGGFGLNQQLVFDLPLGRIPVSIFVKGYWNGSGQVTDIYALNSRTGVFDKLTNTGTNLSSKSSEQSYSIMLPRDYADNSGGSFNVITLEFRSASTNTAHRLRLDQVVVAHVDEESSTVVSVPTAADIWSYPSRDLTTPGTEPTVPPTVSEIQSGLATSAEVAAIQADTDAIQIAISGISTLSQADVRSAIGIATANLDTQLAALQADTDDIQTRIPAALVNGRMDSTIDATGMESGAVDNILDEVVEGAFTFRQFLRLFASALGAKLAGGETTTVTIRDVGDTKDRITATVDEHGNRTAISLDLS